MNPYMHDARRIAASLPDILSERGLPADALRHYLLAESRRGMTWLFAILDVQRSGKIERLGDRGTLHQISTALGGRPVFLSNSSGMRYGILMSERPQVPDEIPFPGHRIGLAALGAGLDGPVNASWDDLGHILVGGMTGSGKSNFLRLLAAQALADGLTMALADPDGRTWPELAGNPALMAPLGQTLAGCEAVVDAVQAEINRRRALEPVVMRGEPRLLVMIDEYNGLVLASGGTRSALASNVTQIAWMARKFNVTLVLAGQEWTRDIVGPVRDQMMTRICFPVRRPETSRVIAGRTGAENLRTPGRALADPWGIIQTYLAPDFEPAGDGLSDSERALFAALADQYEGRMTYAALEELGFPRRQADRLRADWLARGLVEQRPEEDNAYCLRERN